MCGAAASTEATRCEHCGARLATVACPSCFGMMFAGEKFCPHCGAKAERTEVAGAAPEMCPRCRVNMEAVVIGKSNLRECPKCEGIWADADSLREICEDREQQSAVLGMASHVPVEESESVERKIQYLPCPVCGELMNRVNFAHCSNVVVDVCSRHGTWFDRDDLRHIVEFVQAGGMEKARAREMEDLEDERRRVAWQSAGAGTGASLSSGTNYALWNLGIGAADGLLRLMMR
jgi:Zn-finger nucleic acid-binding protein